MELQFGRSSSADKGRPSPNLQNTFRSLCSLESTSGFQANIPIHSASFQANSISQRKTMMSSFQKGIGLSVEFHPSIVSAEWITFRPKSVFCSIQDSFSCHSMPETSSYLRNTVAFSGFEQPNALFPINKLKKQKRKFQRPKIIMVYGPNFRVDLNGTGLFNAWNIEKLFTPESYVEDEEDLLRDLPFRPIEPLEIPPFKVIAPNQRIVAIGDLHGDWNQTQRALQLAGVISRDGSCRWTGGSTIVVQVGDVLDRGGDEIAILSLLRHLDDEARGSGGCVFQMNGNHETMNVSEDFRYVSDEGFVESEAFLKHCSVEYDGDFVEGFRNWWKDSQELKKQKGNKGWQWNPIQIQKRVRARLFLFQVGGPLACELARNPVALLVNDNLFAHGGILPHHVEYGLDRMNVELSEWMRGEEVDEGQLAPMPYLVTKGYNSVVWSRLYSQENFQSTDDKRKACSLLSTALELAGASRLIVGHTPQLAGANSECGGRVWRIDVGMSSGIMHAPPQVLEILGSTVKVLGEEQSVSSYI